MYIDIFISILAFISLLLMFDHHHKYIWLNHTILVIFFCYVLYKFVKADNKWQFIKTHPFELISLIPLNGVFRGAMIIRFFRLIVIAKIFKRVFPRLTKILQVNDLYKVLTFTFTVILLAAIPINYFEEDITSFAEGIWWAIVTTTTVGYGDIAPTTTGGRLTAIVLMFVGIGCIGMITGSVSTFFLRNSSKDEDKEYIKKKIDTIETLSDHEYHVLLQLIDSKRMKD